MSIKSVLGIDTVELVIQAAITVILMAWAINTNNERDGMIISFGVGIASLVTLTVRRRLAFRKGGAAGLSTGEMAAERIAELEARVADLDELRGEVAELAERLDFAERLLSMPAREPAALPKGER